MDDSVFNENGTKVTLNARVELLLEVDNLQRQRRDLLARRLQLHAHGMQFAAVVQLLSSGGKHTDGAEQQRQIGPHGLHFGRYAK